MNTPHLNFDKNTNFHKKNFFQFPFVIALLSSKPTAPIYGDLGETYPILFAGIDLDIYFKGCRGITTPKSSALFAIFVNKWK